MRIYRKPLGNPHVCLASTVGNKKAFLANSYLLLFHFSLVVLSALLCLPAWLPLPLTSRASICCWYHSLSLSPALTLYTLHSCTALGLRLLLLLILLSGHANLHSQSQRWKSKKKTKPDRSYTQTQSVKLPNRHTHTHEKLTHIHTHTRSQR